jgi:hypothetical protein
MKRGINCANIFHTINTIGSQQSEKSDLNTVIREGSTKNLTIIHPHI